MTTEPFPLEGLVDRLKQKGGFFNLAFRNEISEGGDGTIYVKNLAPELWRCDFETIDLPHAEIQQLQAELNLMQEGIFTFYAYDRVMASPQADPGGSILGGATPKIGYVNSSRINDIGFKDLPPGYVLTRGDKFCFDYGDPEKRAFHQIYSNRTADGSGVTTSFFVSPIPQEGIAVDIEVTLIKPSCLMMVVPGSVKYTVVNRMKSNLAFSAVQVLAAAAA